MDHILCIDVTCYKCERLVALSNATVWDGRYYCREACLPPSYWYAVDMVELEDRK